MNTPVCEMLGIEFPLLAFSHCRDVVASVTNAGAFGVLGAMRYDADELEIVLRWIDEQVGGKPYGVDVIVPQTYEGKGEELDPGALASRISDAHWEFLERLLAEHELSGVWNREIAIASSRASGLFSDAMVDALLDVAFSHPIRLIANARLATLRRNVLSQTLERLAGAQHALQTFARALDGLVHIRQQ